MAVGQRWRLGRNTSWAAVATGQSSGGWAAEMVPAVGQRRRYRRRSHRGTVEIRAERDEMRGRAKRLRGGPECGGRGGARRAKTRWEGQSEAGQSEKGEAERGRPERG